MSYNKKIAPNSYVEDIIVIIIIEGEKDKGHGTRVR